MSNGTTLHPAAAQRVSTSSACGKKSLFVEVRSESGGLRVRSRITPRSSAQWSATIVQDRRLAWQGRVRRGELDWRLADLAGSEVVAVRMSDGNGVVCAAQVRMHA